MSMDLLICATAILSGNDFGCCTFGFGIDFAVYVARRLRIFLGRSFLSNKIFIPRMFNDFVKLRVTVSRILSKILIIIIDAKYILRHKICQNKRDNLYIGTCSFADFILCSKVHTR